MYILRSYLSFTHLSSWISIQIFIEFKLVSRLPTTVTFSYAASFPLQSSGSSLLSWRMFETNFKYLLVNVFQPVLLSWRLPLVPLWLSQCFSLKFLPLEITFWLVPTSDFSLEPVVWVWVLYHCGSYPCVSNRWLYSFCFWRTKPIPWSENL